MAPAYHASLTIRPEKGLIVVVVQGVFNREAFTESMHTLWNHPDYPAGKLFLLDFSGADMQFTPNEMQELRKEVRRSPNSFKGKGAMITKTPMQTALGMIYNQNLPEGLEADIFSTWEAACTFLGVSLEDVADLRP